MVRSLFHLSVPCPSLFPSPFSPSVSFVCFSSDKTTVSSDKTLCLTGSNLQFRRGTCGLFMCLTCHCFCKAWHEFRWFACGLCVCVWTYLLDWARGWARSLFFFLGKSCTQTQGWRVERQMCELREGRCLKWDNSHVAKVPAEIRVCEGSQ